MKDEGAQKKINEIVICTNCTHFSGVYVNVCVYVYVFPFAHLFQNVKKRDIFVCVHV